MILKPLVTLDEAKDWLRIDGDAMDDNLNLAIPAASAAVYTYLKRTVPWASEEDMPVSVKLAALQLIGTFIRDPDGANVDAWQYGYLPTPVINLLYPLRDPALS